MEDDVLARVISVEKEIQACLEKERKKAQEWIEEVRKETEKEFIREEGLIREASKMSAEKAVDDAAARAKNIVGEAETKAERLLNVGDEILREIIMRRLYMILPE